MPDGEEVDFQIGPYFLRRLARGKFLVSHDSGEGMEISEAVLQELIATLFKEDF